MPCSSECKSNPPTCDVVHYHSGGRVSDVTWDEATKSLLPCRVPQLQPDLFGRMGKGMRGEIKENKNRRDGNKTRKTRSKRKTLWWQKVNWMKATQSQTNGKRVRWGERERERKRERSACRYWKTTREMSGLGGKQMNNHPSLVTNPPLWIK